MFAIMLACLCHLAHSQLLTLKGKMFAIMLACLCHLVHSQLNPIFVQNPANPNSGINNVFYLTSNSDCNGAVRELFEAPATIKGRDESTTTKQGPTTCTIRLRSTRQLDTTVLNIEVKSMNIQDGSTQVSIYDGDGAQRLMMSFDSRSSQNNNRRQFVTSGNTATFMMSRPSIDITNFDIDILVTSASGGVNPGDTNFGTNYFFDKFPQTAIVGIIGGFYVIVLAICTAILIFCSRSYWGLNKQWETHALATMKTGTTFETKSQPLNLWSVEMKQSQVPVNQYSGGITSKKPRNNVTPKEDGAGVYYNDDLFQKRSLMNDERDKARSRFVSSNASFAETEEDPVDNFKKKTTTSQVNTANKGNKRPPLYKDIVSDHSSYQESEASSSSSSVKKKSLSSEENSSERSRTSQSDTQSDTESEEESESDDHRSRRGARARKHKHKIRQRDSENIEKRPKPKKPQQQQMPLPQMQQAQFVPMMVGPQFQAVPMVPSYQPPTYSQNAPQIQPTDPPVYSYLVRRGYTPLEEHSNSLASTLGSHRSDGEPELRLGTGVDYMRR